MEVALAIVQIFKDAVATILIIFLIWLVLAVLTLQIEERISTTLAWRVTMLEDTISTMLGEHVKDRFYAHPLIRGLYTDQGKRAPGVIPQDKFALVLFEMVLNSGAHINTGANTNIVEVLVPTTFKKLKNNVADLKTQNVEYELNKLATTLDTLLIGIEEDRGDTAYAITVAQTRVESWFNDAMERLGGAYRRRVQNVFMVVGITLAAVFNVDTSAIANTLWKDSVTKQAIATQASQLKEPGSDKPASTDAIISYINQSQGLSLPIGWSSGNIPTDENGWMTKIIGILFSGMMAAQGAPYWFDFMRKLLSRQVVIGQPQA